MRDIILFPVIVVSKVNSVYSFVEILMEENLASQNGPTQFLIVLTSSSPLIVSMYMIIEEHVS